MGMVIPMPLILALLLLIGAAVEAQSPASSPGPASAGTDCSTQLLGLSDCLSYVSEGSNVTKPDKGCCPALSGLVNNAPQCLCQLLGSGAVVGLPIDKKKSMKLPKVCKVVTPPVSLCSLFGVPVASPTPAPMSGEAPVTGDAPMSEGAFSPGPASAGTDCSTQLLGLADCLSYVSAGSNVTKPDKGCCPALSGLVDSAPQCLCQLLGSGEVEGLPIDKKKSMKLPKVCKVVTPPVSLCSMFGVPVSGPATSPMSGGATSPPPMSGGATSPSNGGLDLPTSFTPSLPPSITSKGSRGFRGFNALFFVSILFTIFNFII